MTYAIVRSGADSLVGDEPGLNRWELKADRGPPSNDGDLNESISFGDFRLLPAARSLLKNGLPVNIGARALDVLIILLERPGEVIARREVEARAYPGLAVGDGALRFQIAALRRALSDGEGGARYIANVNGRGYCFTAPTARNSELADRTTANTTVDRSADRFGATSSKPVLPPAASALSLMSDMAKVISAIVAGMHANAPVTVSFALLGRRGMLVIDGISNGEPAAVSHADAPGACGPAEFDFAI